MENGDDIFGTDAELFDPEWKECCDRCQQNNADPCKKCGKSARIYLRNRDPKKPYGGKMICANCNAYIAFIGKPRDKTRRPKESLGLAEKHRIYHCEMCLREEHEVPNESITGHHVIEDYAKNDRGNIWGLCQFCHQTVTNIRNYIGRHERKVPPFVEGEHLSLVIEDGLHPNVKTGHPCRVMQVRDDSIVISFNKTIDDHEFSWDQAALVFRSLLEEGGNGRGERKGRVAR